MSTQSELLRGQANVGEIFYTLSVNFLMYVVLIIVFYMIVRFYLEEETTHKDYRGYAPVSTLEEESEGEEKLELAGSTDSVGGDSKNLIHLEEEEGEMKQDVERSLSRSTSAFGGFTESFLNINEWGEPEGTKQEVLQKIAFCATGLIISFSIWGLVQERILTQPYDGDFFEFSYGLVFINRFTGLLFSAYLMYHFQVPWVSSPLWEYSFPSVANMLSSWCQYEALKYVSFPTQMLAKSFKILPVMLMGKFMHNKSYESYEYISAALIGFGLYLFIDSSEHIDLKQNSFGNPESMGGAMSGVVLLIMFLFFDSFTGQWQTRMFKLNKQLSPLQMMLIMNAFSAVFSFITLVHQEEFFSSIEFLFTHKLMAFHVLIFCICSTVGQLFIFYTVKTFGAVVFSIIMSSRILCSTILSCLVYSHPVTELGVLGILIVFASLAYRTRMQTEGKPLIRWRETEEETKEVFHEWHEHLDI